MIDFERNACKKFVCPREGGSTQAYFVNGEGLRLDVAFIGFGKEQNSDDRRHRRDNDRIP